MKCMSIANWNPNGAVYTGSQVVAAELGKEYHVTLTDGIYPQSKATLLETRIQVVLH